MRFAIAGLLVAGLLGIGCQRVLKQGFDAFQFSSVDTKDIDVTSCSPPTVC